MNRRRRELLAALQPVADVAMRRAVPEGRKTPPGFHVRNEGATRELMIYGRIGSGGWFDDGIGATDVAAGLRELGPGPVDVRINSGGGDVFDGVAIHTLLARHNGTITTHVDGLAASAASFIAMAGDLVVMARNGFMMIHDGMTGTYGNSATHRGSADLLDKVSETIADMYAERAGEDVDHWRALMTVNGEDGTWFTGQEALAAGLADQITGAEDPEDRVARNLSGWSAAILNVAPAPIRERVEQLLASLSSDDAEEQETEEEEPAPLEQQEQQEEQDIAGEELAFAFLAGQIGSTA